VAELKKMANSISENLHRLARDLRPASLDYLGLVAALRQYAHDFGQQHNLAMHFEAVGFNDRRLPATVETNLYRIVQEALTNIVRHAQATRVDIFLEQRSDQIILIVEDNGVGFDTEPIKQQGRLGLLGMQERTEMLNGVLAIESTIGTGTTIYVEAPYEYSDSYSR
jgi:signal transduction histidine kinase